MFAWWSCALLTSLSGFSSCYRVTIIISCSVVKPVTNTDTGMNLSGVDYWDKWTLVLSSFLNNVTNMNSYTDQKIWSVFFLSDRQTNLLAEVELGIAKGWTITNTKCSILCRMRPDKSLDHIQHIQDLRGSKYVDQDKNGDSLSRWQSYTSTLVTAAHHMVKWCLDSIWNLFSNWKYDLLPGRQYYLSIRKINCQVVMYWQLPLKFTFSISSAQWLPRQVNNPFL